MEKASLPSAPPPYSPNPHLPAVHYNAVGQYVVGIQPTVVVPTVPVAFGPRAATLTCPSCSAIIKTTIRTQPNIKTHLVAIFLCLMGCFPCCLCLYCMDSCQSINHYCPNCNAYLGKYD